MDDSDLQNIFKIVTENITSLVIAPTGSGKSVKVPSYVGLNGKKIFVSGPTVAGTRSLHTFVSAQFPKLNVGYAAESQRMYDNSTMTVYVTSGHLRRKMMSYFAKGEIKDIDFCDILMIDEMHSGSLDNTINVALWQKAYNAGVKVPNLLLVSATPADMPVFPLPKIYEVFVRTYPVSIVYHDVDILWTLERGNKLFNALSEVVEYYHQEIPIEDGAFLIFLPGKKEVDTVMGLLEGLPNSYCAAAYGSLKKEELAEIFSQPEPGFRKIVVSTNITETTITIDGLVCVFDTLLEKRAETSSNDGERLTTTYVSQDSAKQRAGRTGRTNPGICYRMCTEDFFQNQMEKHRPPEILRIPIYEPVMGILETGQDPKEILQDAGVTKIEKAMELLEKLKMIEQEEDGSVKVTELGHFSPAFPLGVRDAAFYYHWIKEGYHPFVGIVVATLIDSYGPSYFYLPRKERDETDASYYKKLKNARNAIIEKYRGKTDLHTAIKVWLDLFANEPDIKPMSKRVFDWCRINNMNAKKINEILTIVKECVKISLRKGIPIQMGTFNPDNVVNKARPILQKVYEDRIVRLEKGGLYDENNIVYRFDVRESFNEIDKNTKYFLALCTQEIKAFTTMNIISFSIDLPDYKPPKNETTKNNVLLALKMMKEMGKGDSAILSQLGINFDESKKVNCNEIAAYSRHALRNFNEKEEVIEFFANPFFVEKPIDKEVFTDFRARLNLTESNKTSLNLGSKTSLHLECKRFKHVKAILNLVSSNNPAQKSWVKCVKEILLILSHKDVNFLSFEEDNVLIKEILIKHGIVVDMINPLRKKIKKFLTDLSIFEVNVKMEKNKVVISFEKEICYSNKTMKRRIMELMKEININEIAALVMRYLTFDYYHETYDKKIFDKINKLIPPINLEGYGCPFTSNYIGYYCGPYADLESPLNNIGKFPSFMYEETTVLLNPPPYEFLENNDIDHVLANIEDAIKQKYFVRYIVDVAHKNDILEKSSYCKEKLHFNAKVLMNNSGLTRSNPSFIYLLESDKKKSSILKKIFK